MEERKYTYEIYSSENSENAAGDLNMDKKYSILESNHRRLLGVTTALTEALENTVRGDEFDLEDTLNHCMAIYPQLFAQKQKTPSSKAPKKIYNTSVSEDVTDNIDTETTQISNYEIQKSKRVVHSPIAKTHHRHKLTQNDRETLTIDVDDYPNVDTTKSAILIGPDDDNEEKLLSAFNPATIQTIRISGAPEIYVDQQDGENNNSYMGPNFGMDELGVKNNISDISPYLLLSEESRRHSLSSQFSDNEYRLPKINDLGKSYGSRNRVIHELRHVEEPNQNSKQVHNDFEHVEYKKRPKSYASENTSWLTTERNHSQMNESQHVIRNQENNNQSIIYNQNIPYEITLQQKNQHKPSVNSDANNLMIKIVPELHSYKKPSTPREEKQRYQSSMNKQKVSNSVHTQTVISTPSETCIIITNQLDPGIVFLSNDYSVHENQVLKQEVVHNNEQMKTADAANYSDDQAFDNSTDRRLNHHITIEKLKKLSTGLKVQSDVMQAVDSDSCYDNENMKQVNTIKEIKSAYSNLGKQPENQNACNAYPFQTHDEMEKQNLIKLKDDLANGSVKQKCTILQSLRSKLIHTLAQERSSLVNLYIENDILNIHRNPTMLETLMPKEIVNGWDLILQEMILKYLNTMCSMWKGRDYLTSNLSTVNCLQGYFFDKYSTESNNTTGDLISKEMLIAIYHKLSTRQNQQTLLLNSGVAEKVAFNILETNESMTTYRLRHSIGLLINLCVCNEGRALLEPMALDILKMLVKLLNSKDKKILPYVARILYVLMASELFHKTARDIHLGETLVDAINVSKKRVKLQLEVLKNVIEQPSHHQNLTNAEESFLQNIEAELDELEEEVETAEPRLATPKPDYFEHEESFRCADKKIYENDFDNVAINQKPEVTNILSTTKNLTSPIKSFKKTKVTNLNDENLKIDLKKKKIKQPKSIIILDDKNIAKPKTAERTLKQNQNVQRNRLRKSNSKVKHEIEESLNNTPRLDEADTKTETNIKETGNRHRLSPNMIQNQGTKAFTIENEQSPRSVKDDSVNMDDKTSFLVVNDNQLNPANVLHGTSPQSVIKMIEYQGNNDSLKLIESERGIAAKSPSKVIQQQNVTSKSRPASQGNDNLSQTGRKHSLFSPDGRVSANDYEYCEDTKQIQTPIQQNNIFRDSRQSPYRSRLNDAHKENNTGGERNVMSRAGYVSPRGVEKKYEMATSSSENDTTQPKK